MEIFAEALNDTAALLPLLAAIYFFIGFLEYRYGDGMSRFIARLGPWGPVAGALVGCIPQCGFSVIASALYVKRLVSVGTLLAVFLSTSDEAVPILLSMPGKAGMVGLLIAIKVLIAITAGIAVDRFTGPGMKNVDKGRLAAVNDCSDAVEGHPGCCSHGLHGRPSKLKALLLHPLRHTAKIFVFLLLLSAAFNLFVKSFGQHRIEALLLNGNMFQPVLAALIGLIPSCFASVILAGLFAKGIISFASMVAGLCAGSGLGILVLLRENKDIKDSLFVIGMLLSISISTGVLIELLAKVVIF